MGFLFFTDLFWPFKAGGRGGGACGSGQCVTVNDRLLRNVMHFSSGNCFTMFFSGQVFPLVVIWQLFRLNSSLGHIKIDFWVPLILFCRSGLGCGEYILAERDLAHYPVFLDNNWVDNGEGYEYMGKCRINNKEKSVRLEEINRTYEHLT